ncbi:MAG TPA: hypothetical protein VLE49_14655, partial [Anaerolineales bacterium]|nr:hypothetical protein [Anaerolineales bacterium]
MSTYFKKANLVLVLILIIGLCFPGSAHAAPGTSVAQSPSFGKSSPANNATVGPANLKLQWQSISNIFQYRYCYYSYDITTNVCNIDNKATWISNGSSTSITLPALVGNKKYYWQVGAKLNDNSFVYANGSLSAKWAFTTTASGTTTTTPVDKFIYDDTDSKWTFTGTWTLYNGTGPYNNTVHYGTVGSDAQITFNGTKFTLTYVKGSNRGLMDVYVDGVLQTTINAHSTGLSWKQTWSSPTFPADSHTVQLVNAGGGTFVDVDAIEVSGVVPGGTYDDASINWVYTGTWATYSGTGPYNNTLHYTGITGSGAEFSFDGIQFTVTYAKSTNRGLIDVTVDGVYVDTINAYSTTTKWKQTWTSPTFPAGVHTVRFEYAGSGAYIDVDAIKIVGTPATVNPGIYDDAHAAWTYTGSWTAYSGAGPYNNTVHYTSTAGNTAEITFRGTKFNLIYTRASNRGSIDIAVDGWPVALINANNASTLWKQIWTSPTFPQGDHTITITHSGIGTFIDVDAVEVFGMVPVGTYDDNNSNWTYSGVWTASTVSGAYSSTLHKTSTVGSDAEITFDGARFILTYTKGSDRGLIDVYVDGF